MELSDNNQKEYNEKYIGKTAEVLFEEQDGEYIKGHTDNYIVVKVKNNNIEQYHNKIKRIKIIDKMNEELIGIL